MPLSFTADADVVKRECKLDSGAYATCTSGWSGITAATADGEHSYRVRVTDDVGNVAESAVRTTVLDRTLPVLAFTDGPTEGQQVVTRNAAITFSLSGGAHRHRQVQAGRGRLGRPARRAPRSS